MSCVLRLMSHLLRLPLQSNSWEESARGRGYQLCPDLFTVLCEKHRHHPGTEARVLGDGVELDPAPDLVPDVALGSEGLTARPPLVQLPVRRVVADTLPRPARQEV